MKTSTLLIVFGIIVLLGIVILVAGFWHFSNSDTGNAPGGEDWETHLRYSGVIEENSGDIRIENRRQLTDEVISLDVYETLVSGHTRYTLVYTDTTTGQSIGIMSYVLAGEDGIAGYADSSFYLGERGDFCVEGKDCSGNLECIEHECR